MIPRYSVFFKTDNIIFADSSENRYLIARWLDQTADIFFFVVMIVSCVLFSVQVSFGW